jgi:nitrite reductase (NO-forming)
VTDTPDAPTPSGEPEDAADARRDSRRAFLRRVGVGGAGLAGTAALAHTLVPHRHAEAAEPSGTGTAGTHGAHAYGGAASPPLHLPADHLDPVTVPPPPRPLTDDPVELEVVVTERTLLVADETPYDAWVYGGTAPGPIIRATEGQQLRIRLRNRTSRPHNLHLHGRHSPQMDGWEPVPPGGETTYEITAAPFGLHPYHCHTPPLAEHIARGLYGAFLVDPVEPRPAAHEFVLVLSGWDLDGDGVNELYAWNGVAGFFHRHPLRVPVGDLVRCYVLNLTEHDPIGSFHLHAQTFDVLWQGTTLEPDLHADTVTLAQGDRAIVEFTLPERGRYMFHPHQHHMADRGAMGWFAAV